MPLYEFECLSCGFEFEELANKKDMTAQCRKCGQDTKKKMSSFSSVVPGSSNELIDVKVGRAAEKRWEMHHDRQDKRRKGKKLQELKVPKIGNKFVPALALGSKEERTQRKDYSVALQEHRRNRKKRGQKQFSDAGSF